MRSACVCPHACSLTLTRTDPPYRNVLACLGEKKAVRSKELVLPAQVEQTRLQGRCVLLGQCRAKSLSIVSPESVLLLYTHARPIAQGGEGEG